VIDSKSNLRAGDALHLAVAKYFKAKSIITLDKVFEKNASRLKIKTIVI
jgi:predicted nucleic acid-binding protein